MRLRQSINVAGDAFGRWVAHRSFLGTGAPLASIPPRLRSLVRADPGHDLWVACLRHAELWSIAEDCNALGDPQLLRDLTDGLDVESATILAVAYGDGDVSLSERLLEASWRAGKPLRVVSSATCKKQMRLATDRYPGLRRRTERVKGLLQRDGRLTAASGLTREFFGKKDAPETIKDALRFVPRANAAHWANQALLKARADGVTPLGVTYDDLEGEATLLAQASTEMRETLPGKAADWWNHPLALACGPSWGEAQP